MASDPNSILNKLFSTNHRVLLERNLAADLKQCRGTTLVIGAGYDPYQVIDRPKNYYLRYRSDLENIDILYDADSIPLPDASIGGIVSIEVFGTLRSDRCRGVCKVVEA